MWKNGRTAMMRSCSATWCTQAVWSRLATRLRCVSTTPLGNPVVPLEYGSTARSCAGSTRARGAAAPVSSSAANGVAPVAFPRSEEHTSELQSQSNLVCRLLLEKKKKKETSTKHIYTHGTNNITTQSNH